MSTKGVLCAPATTAGMWKPLVMVQIRHEYSKHGGTQELTNRQLWGIGECMVRIDTHVQKKPHSTAVQCLIHQFHGKEFQEII